MARAFSIGKAEAAALVNIMTYVPSVIVDRLEQAVSVRGMQRFLNHDVLGQKLLNLGFTSGINGLEQRRDILRNTDDHKVVSWMCVTQQVVTTFNFFRRVLNEFYVSFFLKSRTLLFGIDVI